MTGFFKDKKNIAMMVLCVLCLGLLYYRVAESLVYDWINLPDFSHGFLIPLFSLYLAWERRHLLDTLSVRPSTAGVVILLGGIVLLLLGNLAHESFTMRFSFLVVLSGMTVFLLGWEYFKAFSFPIAFLIFMIPIPSILMQKITFPLQLLVSQLSQHTLDVIGIPVLREGNIIVLWNARLEVAEACSGIRSLMMLLVLGIIVAYYTQKDLWKQAVIITSCIPIAIIANVVRVVITVILTDSYGVSVLEGFHHGGSGLMTFIVGLLLLLLVGGFLARLGKTKEGDV